LTASKRFLKYLDDRINKVEDHLWQKYEVEYEEFTRKTLFGLHSDEKVIFMIPEKELGQTLVDLKALIAGDLPSAVCLTDAEIKGCRYPQLRIIAVRIGSHVTTYSIRMVRS